MKRNHAFLKALRYLPDLPLALARVIGELIRDAVLYFFGRHRAARWPEQNAASSLLPSTR